MQVALRNNFGGGLQLETVLENQLDQSFSSSSNTDTDSLSLRSELTTRVGNAWTVKGRGTFDRIIDKTGTSPESWTISPRIELQYSPSVWSLLGSYAYLRSVRGTPVETHTANLAVNGDIPLQFATLSLRLQVEYERSNNPAHESWDVFTSGTLSF